VGLFIRTLFTDPQSALGGLGLAAVWFVIVGGIVALYLGGLDFYADALVERGMSRRAAQSYRAIIGVAAFVALLWLAVQGSDWYWRGFTAATVLGVVVPLLFPKRG